MTDTDVQRRTLGNAVKQLVKLPSHPSNVGGCWIWQAQFHNTVPIKTWFKRSINARRWLWELLIGPIKDGQRLYAKCGENRCVNPAHMKVVTLSEAARLNLSDVVAGDVDDIKELHAGGAGPTAIARKLGLSVSAVRNVLYANQNRVARRKRSKE